MLFLKESDFFNDLVGHRAEIFLKVRYKKRRPHTIIYSVFSYLLAGVAVHCVTAILLEIVFLTYNIKFIHILL